MNSYIWPRFHNTIVVEFQNFLKMKPLRLAIMIFEGYKMDKSFELKSDRIRALLAAVKDIAPPGHPKPIPIDKASQLHRELFERYVSDLRRAKEEAEEWLEGIVTTLMERTRGDRERAIK